MAIDESRDDRDLVAPMRAGVPDDWHVDPVLLGVPGVRRPGDPDRIVADGTLAARDLDWEMRHTLLEMVTSAWDAAPRP